MATLRGLDRVAAVNQSIAKTGGISTQQATPNTPTGSGGPITTQNTAITSGIGGAVNASGQIIGAGGQVMGAANPKDISPTAVPAENVPMDTSAPTNSPTLGTTNTTQPSQPSGLPGMSPLTGSTQQQAGQAIDQLKQKYGKALTDIVGTGVAAPASQGAGISGVGAALSTQPQAEKIPEAVSNFFTPENPAIQESTKSLLEWLNPAADRQMLNDHIAQLAVDRAALSGLKTELMNTKRIMQGTEQDLRDEITKAGGFATESQVQALSIARNKSLVQKAQLISDQIQSQTDIVNADISLVGDEKQMAAQQFSQRMSLMNYQQQNAKDARNATNDTFNNIVKALGYDGAYLAYQSDPAQLKRIEEISGLGSGGFLKAATLASTERATEQKKSDLQNKVLESNLLTDQAQRANLYSQANERNNPSAKTIDGKPQTASQASANSYANRLTEASQIIDSVGGNFTKVSSLGGMLPNQFQSAERQSYEQAKKNFVTAVLRRESGASISPTEFSTAEKQYFPQAGDKPSTIEQKATSRNTVINNFYSEANVKRPTPPGTIIESGGKKYKVGADGETLTPL